LTESPFDRSYNNNNQGTYLWINGEITPICELLFDRAFHAIVISVIREGKIARMLGLNTDQERENREIVERE